MSQIYEIGKTYKVKCGLFTPKSMAGYKPPLTRKLWMPLIGEKHCDTEIIGVSAEHYHIDWRFVSNRVFLDLAYPKGEKWVHSYIIEIDYLVEFKVKRLKMLRQMPDYPNQVRFTHGLEAHYKNATLIKHRCPHQGTDLSNIAPNDQGQIVCPLHGLRFCQKSLKLIPTALT